MNYCVLDLETSGYSPVKNGICQVACIVIDEHFKEVARFDMYVQPYGKWHDPKAEKAHGLTKKFLTENGSSLVEVINQWLLFLQKYPISHFVGHNIRVFDKKFLIEAMRQVFIIHAMQFNKSSFYDTLEMSWIHKGVKNHSLKTMCEYFGIKHRDDHNAIHDCESTVELFKKLKV